MTREEAQQLAAQAWCEPTTSMKVMDPDLAFAFAEILLREVAALAKERDEARTAWRKRDEDALAFAAGATMAVEQLAAARSEADALRAALTTFVECHEHPMGPASACSLCAPARPLLAAKGAP